MLTKATLTTITFLALVLGAIQPASAQQLPEDTAAHVKSNARKRISLDEDQPFSPASQQAKIAGITVVNALWDTSRLGFLQVGLFNKKVEAVPDKPMGTFLQDYVNAAYGNLYQPGNVTLLWVVEELRIGERTGAMSEKAFVRLKATAYATKDGREFRPVTTIDEVKQVGGMDVTHKHKSNITKAFKKLYEESVAHLDAALPDAPAVTYDDVIKKHTARRETPALKVSKMDDGVYLSYEDFLQNKPAITRFELSGSNARARVYTVASDGGKSEVPQYWGVVKNGEVYKYKEGHLIPLERDGFGYVISSYIADYKRRNRSIIWGSVAGGITGAAIMSASTGLQYADAFPTLKVSPEATAIDMETGELIF
jgi:hypothetical protein